MVADLRAEYRAQLRCESPGAWTVSYADHLDRLRDLTAELHRLNDQAAIVYRKRRETMTLALAAGAYPEAIAKACGTSSISVKIVIASLELDRVDWEARDAQKARQLGRFERQAS